MSKTLRLLLIAVLGCVIQTTLVGYFRIASIAPDMMIALLVAITSHGGPYEGFCIGAVMAMLYDSSVGYVMAINLVGYTFIGWSAPLIRGTLHKWMRKLKHKSYLEMLFTSFFLTLVREILYIGYLFLIGSEQSMVTLMRMVLCASYTALMVLPCGWCVKKIMTWHPQRRRKKSGDLYEDLKENAATETKR